MLEAAGSSTAEATRLPAPLMKGFPSFGNADGACSTAKTSTRFQTGENPEKGENHPHLAANFFGKNEVFEKC